MKEAFLKTVKNFKRSIPIIFGVLLLINLINSLLGKFYLKVFTGNLILDPIIGALAGSISFGIPITSYIAGGELLKGGVSLLAVSAFILTWATVGLAMLPLEISYLGKRFAISRNFINFIFGITIAVLTIMTLNIL